MLSPLCHTKLFTGIWLLWCHDRTLACHSCISIVTSLPQRSQWNYFCNVVIALFTVVLILVTSCHRHSVHSNIIIVMSLLHSQRRYHSCCNVTIESAWCYCYGKVTNTQYDCNVTTTHSLWHYYCNVITEMFTVASCSLLWSHQHSPNCVLIDLNQMEKVSVG